MTFWNAQLKSANLSQILDVPCCCSGFPSDHEVLEVVLVELVINLTDGR